MISYYLLETRHTRYLPSEYLNYYYDYIPIFLRVCQAGPENMDFPLIYRGKALYNPPTLLGHGGSAAGYMSGQP